MFFWDYYVNWGMYNKKLHDVIYVHFFGHNDHLLLKYHRDNWENFDIQLDNNSHIVLHNIDKVKYYTIKSTWFWYTAHINKNIFNLVSFFGKYLNSLLSCGDCIRDCHCLKCCFFYRQVMIVCQIAGHLEWSKLICANLCVLIRMWTKTRGCIPFWDFWILTIVGSGLQKIPSSKGFREHAIIAIRRTLVKFLPLLPLSLSFLFSWTERSQT